MCAFDLIDVIWRPFSTGRVVIEDENRRTIAAYEYISLKAVYFT